ncbi:MAG: molybdopterin-binding protein, partial [Pseudomonadota bacterium]
MKIHGGRIKKGTILSLSDIEAIAKTRAKTVVVAQPSADDVDENDAALRIAQALQAKMRFTNIELGAATTGRVNLYAACNGLLGIDRAVIDAANHIDPSITIATLPPESMVGAGRMVATVKIIPFAVPSKAVDAVEFALRCAVEEPIVVHGKFPKRVALIQTTLPSIKSNALDKTRKNLETRLRESSSWLHDEIRIPHDERTLAETLQSVRVDDDAMDYNSYEQLIIIFGASAITDIDDVIPAALRASGGTVETLGMPVDPGNLLMVGNLYGRDVIGAPGCARSSSENGFDWVLRRMTHMTQTDYSEWVPKLGVGGLLMEIHDR